jgi:hypothetical protein
MAYRVSISTSPTCRPACRSVSGDFFSAVSSPACQVQFPFPAVKSRYLCSTLVPVAVRQVDGSVAVEGDSEWAAFHAGRGGRVKARPSGSLKSKRVTNLIKLAVGLFVVIPGMLIARAKASATTVPDEKGPVAGVLRWRQVSRSEEAGSDTAKRPGGTVNAGRAMDAAAVRKSRRGLRAIRSPRAAGLPVRIVEERVATSDIAATPLGGRPLRCDTAADP